MDFIVKSVRFGDCFILKSRTNGMLIDCGSANRDQSNCAADFAYGAIKKEIASHTITDILISHFDTDHYNGILRIPETYRVKNTYIPYCVTTTRVKIAREISLLLTIAPARKWGFQLSDSIVRLLLHLVKISDYIRPVYRGKQIPFDSDSLPVLWPALDMTEQEDCNGQLHLTLPTDKDYEQQLFAELTEYIQSEEEIEQIRLAYHRFYKTFLRFFDSLYEQNAAQNDFAPEVSNAKELLLYVRNEIILKRMDKLSAWSKKIADHAYHSLINSMNAVSIVCHAPQKLLLLGDAPPKIISYIQDDFSPSYQLVKLPHHGTANYYSAQIPQGEYWIISNGGFANRPICAKYITDCSGTIICTHGHTAPKQFCLFAAKSGHCSHCICVNQAYSVGI